MNRPSLRLAVLASGRGSNLQAIIDARCRGELDCTLTCVISDRPGARALDRARGAGVDAVCLRPRMFPTRDDYERAVVAELRRRDTELVALAGYMRLVGPVLLEAFPQRIVNIHPALLPAFPGLDAQRQALEYGVKVSGCTVHFVDAGMDTGPIILQRAVPVRERDTTDSLAARILAEEHRAYPEALRLVQQGRLRVEGRKVRILPGAARGGGSGPGQTGKEGTI